MTTQVEQFPIPVSDEEVEQLLVAARYRWSLWQRSDQKLPRGDWWCWILRAGRGSGKTRTGAETIIDWAKTGTYRRFHLIAPTAGDVRNTMIEGPAGILACSPPWFMPKYEPSKTRLTWPNGAVAILFSGDEPERLRGPQCEAMWADETCAWRYCQEAWDMAMFGLRLGDHPRAIVTTTPKPTKWLKELRKQKGVVETTASTYDNLDNLAPTFREAILSRYEGTRLGKQELDAHILDDNPNALWKREWIDDSRVSKAPDLRRIVVGVDPAATSGEEANATGIVVAGVDGQKLPHYYILDDLTVDRATPGKWGYAVVVAYHRYEADMVVPEINNGGEMVVATIQNVDPAIPCEAVHASRGKRTRAEPVSTLAEQGRIHHVGTFPELEDELCEWDPGDSKAESPNRLDAAVWAITELQTPRRKFRASRVR